MMERAISSLAIDLTQMHRRTVTSFYSNLVTRPTGQAVRMGVESQLMELEGSRGICLSILDFSQVMVLDFSCADEIVAKLLLRYVRTDRPGEAYFIARGLQDHHRESVEAVLERHDLRLVAQGPESVVQLLGPSDPAERACWKALNGLGRGTAEQVGDRAGLAVDAAAAVMGRMVAHRTVVPLRDGAVCTLAALGQG